MDQILRGEFPTEEASSIYPSRFALLARLEGIGHIPSTGTWPPSATGAIDAFWVCAAAQVYDRVARASVDFERLVNSDPIQRETSSKRALVILPDLRCPKCCCRNVWADGGIFIRH